MRVAYFGRHLELCCLPLDVSKYRYFQKNRSRRIIVISVTSEREVTGYFEVFVQFIFSFILFIKR